MIPTQPVMQLPSDNKQLMLKVEFPHFTAEELFAYFTQPALLVQWWPQAATIEPEVGGHYRLSWPAMNWHLSGEYTDFEPGQRLGFTWQWEYAPDMPGRQVDILLSPLAQGSQLKLTHSPYSDNERDQIDRQSHLDGWNHFLARLWSLKG